MENLQPVTGRAFDAPCILCTDTIINVPQNGLADLNGEPFKAYYHRAHATQVDGKWTLCAHEQNNCDGSGPHSCGEVRVLPTTPGSNAILCKADYIREIVWRRFRNGQLAPDARYDLPEWESLRVYGADDEDGIVFRGFKHRE